MIHEIAPHVLDNQFKIQDPKADDYCILYNGSKSLLKKTASGYAIPTVSEIPDFEGHYLLNIDGRAYFTQQVAEDYEAPEGFEFMGNRSFRTMSPLERMGGATAAPLGIPEQVLRQVRQRHHPRRQGTQHYLPQVRQHGLPANLAGGYRCGP